MKSESISADDQFAKVTPDGAPNPRSVPVCCLTCRHYFKAEIQFDSQPWRCPHCGRKNYWFPKEEIGIW